MHAAYRAVFSLAAALGVVLSSVAPSVGAQVFAAGVDHNCTLSTTGGVVCWGSNQYGQIGDGTTILRTTPTNVSLPFGVTALAGNWGQSCAVTASGGAMCWGWNDFGQLGDGTKTQRTLPTDVSELTSGVSKIAAGYGHTCALTTGGGVKCWGGDFSPDSNQGQLGNGSNAASLVPVDVIGLGSGAGAQAIATGKAFTCAVTAMGGAKCWGANDFDQLGDNDPMFLDQNTPVDVFGLTSGVASLATGEAHACALTTAGGVKCWGLANTGALGNNSHGNLTQPIASDVTGLTSGVAAITAGSQHTCAMKSTGEVLCWGRNDVGQVGDGTTTQRNTPVSVATGAVAIAAGSFHTCMLTAPGVSQCWGNNAQGNMGTGSQGSASYTPVATTYAAATSTSVASGANPSTFGDSVTFTATVSGGINGVGVRFESDGTVIASCASVALASGTAGCTTNSLAGGSRSIRATYLGNATTLASQSTALGQTVNKADQSITFDPLANKNDNDPPFTVTASASSGLGVTFISTTPGVCTVAGTTVTLQPSQGGNTCTIATNQGGNGNYNAAPQVTQSFSVLNTGPTLALVGVESRKTHGTAGTFAIPINPATSITGLIDVEPRMIGPGHNIVFVFNTPVTGVGAVTVTDKDSLPIGAAVTNVSGNEVTVTITSVSDAKRVRVALAGVTPGSFSFSASVGFFVGDVSGNRLISASDLGLIKGRSGVINSTSFRYDINLNGLISASDLGMVKGRSGALP